MKTLTLVVDERELRTIQAALLLLQEQIDALPEDLAEMLRERGAPLAETEIGELSRRIAIRPRRIQRHFRGDLARGKTLVEIERAAAPALASEPRRPVAGVQRAAGRRSGSGW